MSENEEVVVWNTDNEIMETHPEIAVVSNDSSCSESLFEIMDSSNPEATQSASLLWNAKQITFGSFIKMTKDSLINLEDFNVLVMHYIC